jgi:hypothetical protein
MIEPKELRIGNYLKSLNGHVVQVTKIETSQLCVEGLSLPSAAITTYDYVQPISLSPELLEKNGFLTLSGGESRPLYFLEQLASNIYFEHSAPGTFSLCIISEDGQFIDLLRSFKHLHELQNIFFSLTGCELNINFAND